jgi:hypothetical protein
MTVKNNAAAKQIRPYCGLQRGNAVALTSRDGFRISRADRAKIL